MKRMLSIVMALVLVLSLGTVAFADETAPETSGAPEVKTYTDMSTVTLTKEYKLTNAGTTSPAETFAFSTLTCTGVTDAAEGVATADAPVPTINSATFEAGAAGDEAKGKQTVTITLPTYTSVGIYTYTFTETDGGTAGVTYRSEAIKLVVTVIEQNGKVRVAGVHTEAANAAKSNTFDNTYSAGSLAVTKAVTGQLGDTTKEFTVKVKFTAPVGDTVKSNISYVVGSETKTIEAGESGWTGSKEVEITLKNEDTVIFTNIPYGVTYGVTENDYTSDGYDAARYDTNKSGTINAASVSTTITNNKDGNIDTGISMDTLPYVLLLAVACMGIIAVVSKKRLAREH